MAGFWIIKRTRLALKSIFIQRASYKSVITSGVKLFITETSLNMCFLSIMAKSISFLVIALRLRYFHFFWGPFLEKEFIKNSPLRSRKLTIICPLLFSASKPIGPYCRFTIILLFRFGFEINHNMKWRALNMSSDISSTLSSEWAEVGASTCTTLRLYRLVSKTIRYDTLFVFHRVSEDIGGPCPHTRYFHNVDGKGLLNQKPNATLRLLVSLTEVDEMAWVECYGVHPLSSDLI